MLNTHRALSTLASTPLQPGFMDILSENTGSLYAGSPYPDYLYECGPNHDDGEYTHWSPFQAVAAKYIAREYPEPRNSTGRALVAFLAGITSHYMADISWHGLAETPSGYGLIETVGAVDFNHTGGLESDAHTFSDLTGEFVAAYENFLPWDDPTQWVIPVADLLAIYRDANRSDVTEGAIAECAVIFFAGAEAVAAAAALAAPVLASDSPTFGESMIDLPVGGIDDMAVMLGRTWGRLAEWIADGPPSPVPGNEYCSVQNPCESRHSSPRLAKVKSGMRVLAAPVRASGLVQEEHLPDGRVVIRRSPHSTPERLVGAIATSLKALARSEPHPFGKQSVSRAGWTSNVPEDVDADHVAARVAQTMLRLSPHSAPQAFTPESVVSKLLSLLKPRDAHVADSIPSQYSNAPEPAEPVFAAASTTALENVGEAIVVGDFDGNGVRELVATAYGASPVGVYVDDAIGLPAGRGSAAAVLPQAGGWYVHSGGMNEATDGPTPLVPSERTVGASVYSRLGASACVLDFNGDGVDDLALGAPTAGWAWSRNPSNETPLFYYQGRVEIFYGVRGLGLPSPIALPSAVLLPTANLTFFGSTLSCSTDLSGDGFPDLVVGSHFAQTAARPDRANGDQAGRVDVFFAKEPWAASASASAPVSAAVTDANWTLIGSDQYEFTGASSAAISNASALGVTVEEAVRAALGARPGESIKDAVTRAPAPCLSLAQGFLDGDLSALANPPPALLMVGSPGYRATSLSSGWLEAGRVAGYMFPPMNSALGSLTSCVRAPPVALFSITADREGLAVQPNKAVKLGAAVALGFPLGFAAAPHFALGMPCVDFCGSSALLPNGTQSVFNTSAGAVAVIPVSPMLRGDFSWRSATAPGGALNPRVMLASRLPDSRFGWRLSFSNVLQKSAPADDLIVGAPMYSRLYIGGGSNPAPTPAGDPGREVGAVFAYAGGAGFPAGSFCSAELLASWWAQGPVQFGRLGLSWASADWDGDGVSEFVVGAPRAALDVGPQDKVDSNTAAATQAEYAGALLVYAIGNRT